MGQHALQSPLPTHFEVFYETEHTLVGTCGNLLCSYSTGAGDYSGLHSTYELHERLRDTYPDGFCKLVVSRSGARMPTEEERNHIQRLTTDFSTHTLCIAMAFEGSGMWMSSMRVVTQTMMLAMRTGFPRRIFATAEEAIPWMDAQCGRAARYNARVVLETIKRARDRRQNPVL